MTAVSQTTLDRVRRAVAPVLGVEPDKISEQSRFIDDLGADSLDCVELVMAIEEEFVVEIDDDDMSAATTVEEMVRIVDGKVAAVLAAAEAEGAAA